MDKGEAEKVGRGKERERKACRIDRKKEGEGGEVKMEFARVRVAQT